MLKRPLNLSISVLLFSILLTVGCSAQQTEEQALASLRQMTSSGKMPPESVVVDIESRFAGKRTGALAKLLHARIRFDNNDFAGAAAILNSDVFRKMTTVADHALWLRAKSLQNAGDHAQAMRTAEELLREFPDSVRARDARLTWAASAIASGRGSEVQAFLAELIDRNDPDALLATAKAYDSQSQQPLAVAYYRRAYFYAPGTAAAKEAEARLSALSEPLTPQNAGEQAARADKLLATRNFAEAANAYSQFTSNFPAAVTPQNTVRKITALAESGRMADARSAFDSLPTAAKEREEGYHQLVLGYAKARQWPQAHLTADEMRVKFPNSTLLAKTYIAAGLAARDAHNKTEESYFLNTAVAAFPNSVDVAEAQFESAWMQHDAGNYALSSQMFIEHLARYADKDTTNRGKAGYWAGRDSERAGKSAEACALYEGVNYRYGSNWYGYLALGRLTSMKAAGNCRTTTAPNPTIAKAIANLKMVTVAAESAGPKELARAEKSEELSTIGLFDWAIDELNEAKKTASKSPKINLALARHYRMKGDNTSAFVALQKSYPDYAQMFPEELGREEWGFFYPLTNWSDIKHWASERRLDPYQVAGLIRQESVFNPRARSGANAYGLMQLLLPSARSIARKYGSTAVLNSAEDLYQPATNIELGTAFFRDQLDKFGRIEYVAVAYNAGPGRVPKWRAALPAEMDEFVEEIPFKETKQYVQGIIRNSAQYRRLYDESGNFRFNVGTRPLRGEIDSRPPQEVTAEFPDLVIDSTGNTE